MYQQLFKRNDPCNVHRMHGCVKLGVARAVLVSTTTVAVSSCASCLCDDENEKTKQAVLVPVLGCTAVMQWILCNVQ
jgi:hypothetical protein